MDQQQANISPTIDGILAHNRAFVERREFERYATDKYPDKKLAIVSCMDTRLTALLLAALGLKNGDAKIIKVAGAEVAHPFGSVMRSLLIAVCELGVEDIMIVAHTNCGAQHMSGKEMVANMERLGVSAERIEFARHCGIDFDKWLAGFGDTDYYSPLFELTSVRQPMAEIGTRAVEFLLENRPAVRQEFLACEVILRQSTGEER